MCHGQIIDQAIRKARKEHRCSYCGREIKPGEQYRRHVQVDGREMMTYKDCKECAVKGAVLWDEHGNDTCYMDTEEGLKETAQEMGWKAFRMKLRAMRERLFGSSATNVEARTTL
jgi:uncharacterized protein with PIN domain